MSTRLPDRSERQLMRHAADRLSVRWYLGYDLDEPLPDHSSLTRVRERYGVVVFRRFFDKIVEQCQAAGLVWGKELYFDGTKVLANASTDSVKPRFAVEAHLANLFEIETNDVHEGMISRYPTLKHRAIRLNRDRCVVQENLPSRSRHKSTRNSPNRMPSAMIGLSEAICLFLLMSLVKTFSTGWCIVRLLLG